MQKISHSLYLLTISITLIGEHDTSSFLLRKKNSVYPLCLYTVYSSSIFMHNIHFTMAKKIIHETISLAVSSDCNGSYHTYVSVIPREQKLATQHRQRGIVWFVFP